MLKLWWQKAWVRGGCYFAIALLIYALLLGWALPKITQQQLPKWFADNTAGQLAIGQIRFHPFSWQLQLDQIALNDSAGEKVMALEYGSINLEPWRSLFTMSVQLDDVTLNTPSAYLIQQNDQLNLADIFAPLASSQPEPEPLEEPTDTAPFPLLINNLKVSNGVASYQVDDGKPLQFAQLSFAAPQLDLRGQNNSSELMLQGPGGGTLALSLTSQFSPLQLQADLQLKQMQLPRYWQFLQLPLSFELSQGLLQLDAHVAVKQQGEQISATINDTTLTLQQLALTQQQQSLVSIDNVTVAGIDLAWPQQQLTIGSVALEGGEGNAAFNQEGFSWLQLMPADEQQGDAKQTAEEQPETASEAETDPWRVAINQASISNWAFNLAESSSGETVNWRIDLDSIRAAPLGTDLSIPIELNLASRINQKAKFDFNGSLQPDNLALQSQLSLTGFDLVDTVPYWQSQAALKMDSGEFGFAGELALTQVEPLTVSYNGDISIDNLVTQDPVGQRDLLKWQKLAFKQVQATSLPLAVTIDTIETDQPYARIIIDADGSTNLSQITASSDETDTADETAPEPDSTQTVAASEEPPFELKIGQILITDGSAFFADNTLTPKFATGIELLEGRIGTLSNKFTEPAKVDITGQVDRYAPVALKGHLQPFGDQRDLDLALSFANIELTSLNPYSGTYAGYYIDQGQLSLDLHYLLAGNALKGDNQVIVNQLKLGKRSDSDKATSLPISLAIALLQDSNGVIDLEMGISGDVDDPSFAIGPLVGKAFANIITKAVTAPFSLLGSLLEGEPPAEYVQFADGATQLDEDATAELVRLAEAMAQRPGLNLSLQGAVSANADRHALAQAKLTERLGFDIAKADEAQWQRAVQFASDEFGADSITDLTTKQPEPEQWQPLLSQRLIEAQVVSEDELMTLAMSRAANTKLVLVEQGKMAPERVFIRETRVNLNTHGSRVDLKLGADD